MNLSLQKASDNGMLLARAYDISNDRFTLVTALTKAQAKRNIVLLRRCADELRWSAPNSVIAEAVTELADNIERVLKEPASELPLRPWTR